MHIGTNTEAVNYTMNSDDEGNTTIEKMEHEKDLGVIIDKNLTLGTDNV